MLSTTIAAIIFFLLILAAAGGFLLRGVLGGLSFFDKRYNDPVNGRPTRL